MRILVVGAGSIGGYFGGRLAVAGRDVTFMVRAARAAQLQRDGMSIVSQYGDFTFAPKTISASEITAPYDVVLLAVKAYSLDAAMKDFAPAVGLQTMILPLLNGMRHIDALVARFGDDTVLGGTTYISTDLDSAGRILHLGPLQDLMYGERSRAVTPRIQALKALLSNATFVETLSPDIVAFMWRKWMMLAALASITCLLRGTIGEVAATPEGLKTAHAIIDECAAIASAEGYLMPLDYLEETHQRLTKQGSDLTASMYRDLQKGAPVEVDQIIGDLLRRGDLHGVDAPLLRAACVQLGIYQAKLIGHSIGDGKA
jgi:2-dehydropantoate 2-reductase